MDTYIDALKTYQKLYNVSLLMLLTICMSSLVKKIYNIEGLFSTIPLIGIKAPHDDAVMVFILNFSIGISFWVSVSLLWWLYSYNKYYSNTSLEVNYLPGLLFMPHWVRFLAALMIGYCLTLTTGQDGKATTNRELISVGLGLINIAPLVIPIWIKRKFKNRA